ncbi:MAG: hypothetical protein ABII12_17560 [Planctomycetota bacterium]
MTKKQGLSLFEAMSKAPQVQHPPRSKGLLQWPRRVDRSVVPTVAEPLTEEEAAAELNALKKQTGRKEAAKAAKETRRKAREARREAKRNKPTPPLSSGTSTTGGRQVRVMGGRLVFSLNTIACIATTAVVCVIMLGVYSLGRRSARQGDGSELHPAAAIRHPRDGSRSPLLPREADDSPNHVADRRASAADPDLSRLLQKPPAKETPVVGANLPSRVATDTEQDTSAAAQLNYLQIESFLISRARSGELVAEDLAAVRRFLAEHGVETVARRHSNGFGLYSQRGFPPGRESESERAAFLKQVEELGRQYRQSGGLYEFRGCMYVSYSRTRAGRPVH